MSLRSNVGQTILDRPLGAIRGFRCVMRRGLNRIVSNTGNIVKTQNAIRPIFWTISLFLRRCEWIRGSVEGAVSISAFAYLYSELVQYHQGRVASISELERRLENSGYGVGFRVLELLAFRSKEVRLPLVFLTNLYIFSLVTLNILFSTSILVSL